MAFTTQEKSSGSVHGQAIPFRPNYPIRDGYTVLTTPERINAPPEVTGRGVTMAFLDSGFYPHAALAGRVVLHVDATSNRVIESRRNFHIEQPMWYSWHGQMTSVVAAGDDPLFPGIARAAKLVLIKVSNRRKQIKEADIERGFRWLLANHRRYRIRVLNVSVGGDYESHDPAHPLHKAVQQLAAEGVITCVASGNSASPRLVPPSSAPAAITVGGLDDSNSRDPDDWNAYQSNWGVAYDGTPKPEIIAPARWIASPILPGTREARMARWLYPMLGADEAEVRDLIRRGHADLEIPIARALDPDETLYENLQFLINKHKIIDAEHQHVDGTSVSVAIVSGVVAQLLEARPNLTPDEVRAVLTGSASILPGIPRERQGGGLINPAKALEMLR
jgi:serine protease AprX